MKYTLNTAAIADDFFDNTRLLGVIAAKKIYQFCGMLNQQGYFNFALCPEYEIQLRRKNRNYFFEVYHSTDSQKFQHFIYQNQYDGEYLLPEYKHIDILWLIKYDMEDAPKMEQLIQYLQSFPSVQFILDIDTANLKNREHIIF